MASRILLACGVALLCIQLALGHGFLQVPKSRNLLANIAGQEYCQHCLSAGGPSVVQSLTPGGLFPTPHETVTSAVRTSLCGEAANIAPSSRKYNPYSAPSVSSLPVYKAGQVIDLEVMITAHHRGHFEFRLCDAAKLSDPRTLTWACLSTLLERVPVAGEVSPVDVNHPERYYLEPECAPNYSKLIKMKYKLPSNLTCERCIMQWWWVSANSCNPPDYGRRSPQPAHVANGCQWWQSNLPACGQAYPEEFWNCADLKISGTVAATPGANTVPPPPPPPPARPITPPTRPITPPTRPVAPPTRPVAPPTRPVTPPARPAPAVPKAAPAVPKAPPAVPKPAPKAPAATGCNKSGTQCGGIGWTGPTCCVTGNKCFKYTQAYSQCRTGSCPIGWLCSAESSKLDSVVEAVKNMFTEE